MADNMPVAQPDGQRILTAAAEAQAPPQTLGQATPVQGVIEVQTAPTAKRARTPRGPTAAGPSRSITSAPNLLEVGASYSMRTIQRRDPNLFIADSQMLFHVLSICDRLMITTERFTRSCPAWIPIVSQLYISMLWITHLVRVSVNSGYGARFTTLAQLLIRDMRIDECVIPGPLVTHFQAITAINGPYTWIGDILPKFPAFNDLWSTNARRPRQWFARYFPLPAIMLDQLIRFANTAPDVNQPNASTFATFQWYDNIFSQDHANVHRVYYLGPQHCGSLNVTASQHDQARIFWSSTLANWIRINTANEPAIHRYTQLLGLTAQDGSPQADWFTPVALTMQKYCQFFNGSVTLASIPTTGIGAGAVIGHPRSNPSVSRWLYPAEADLIGFTSSRYQPRRPIPSNLLIDFLHADPELGRDAEQFAIVAHINIDWMRVTRTNNAFEALTELVHHSGDYWALTPHHRMEGVSLVLQYASLISSRYHQQNANRAE